MTTFVLIHGGGDRGASWELVARALRARGHAARAPDLPIEDPAAGYDAYVDAVVAAAGPAGPYVVVGHSLGGFTAPLAAARLDAAQLVLVAAMIPAPGERAQDYWEHAGFGAFGEDPFFHDVPAELRPWAEAQARDERSRMLEEPWPRDAWPGVPTRVVLCRDDRVFPAARLRAVARERLGLEAEELGGGHCPYLSRPAELAAVLAA